MLSVLINAEVDILEGAVYIYADREGLEELKSYIDYLLTHNDDAAFDLIEGNELSKLDKELIPEGFFEVAYTKIANLDSSDDDVSR